MKKTTAEIIGEDMSPELCQKQLDLAEARLVLLKKRLDTFLAEPMDTRDDYMVNYLFKAIKHWEAMRDEAKMGGKHE